MKRILLACCLLVLGTAAGATVNPSPQPKSILIEEAIGNPYYVTFIFDSSVPRGPAERHVRRAITAAGLRANYIDPYEEQGTFRVEVETNLGGKSGRFQWTIDATPLRQLLGSGGQRIVLELPSQAKVLGGSLRPIGGDTSHRRYVVSSNKTFSGWAEIFGDPVAVAAMVDRLVHHADVIVLKGESYRLKDKDKEVMGSGDGP